MTESQGVFVGTAYRVPTSFLSAVEILRRRALAAEEFELLETLQQAENSLLEESLTISELLLILRGFRAHCRDNELCTFCARELAQALIPTALGFTLGLLASRFEARNETFRSVMVSLAHELHRDGFERSFPSCECRGPMQTLLSILREEMEKESNSKLRAELAVLGEQFELLLSLI